MKKIIMAKKKKKFKKEKRMMKIRVELNYKNFK